MSHFSTKLQEPPTRLKKPTMDPTRNPKSISNQYLNDYGDQAFTSHRQTPAPYDKEPMFEKPLTPSDVGKLNRLVIPKQHAEKYLPLPLGGGDPAGTLLGFEDEAGKCWRFRYSYWNSSQSYVLTKGWSRYVKEKLLDAGDVVFFERHLSEPDRLFIGWRRRGAPPPQHQPGGGVVGLPTYQPEYQCTEEGPAGQEQKATPGSSASNNTTKRLVRLFGVNLECQLNDFSQTTSSRARGSQQAYHNYLN